eukprot:CAMPEP_0170438456 /NCGR_PEP_ID=MMETSP0117_2-20130122/45241_1 /TAXON_ID=400756 /ORGANISM="Durinskia baltica, Strain CSIRO CS-38" /LENGTH=78 /DNA_ID=CAMNT_0010698673 /DNA_START=45 /DNA_END=278 /DNA_ORIENTATION=-
MFVFHPAARKAAVGDVPEVVVNGITVRDLVVVKLAIHDVVDDPASNVVEDRVLVDVLELLVRDVVVREVFDELVVRDV